MRDHSALGTLPASTTGTVIGTTREYVELLSSTGKKASQGSASTKEIRDTLSEVRAIVRPESMLHDQIWKILRGEAVNKSILSLEGVYHKEGGREDFPLQKSAGLPLSGRRFSIWSDGHIALVGGASKPAFDWYEKEMAARAASRTSPYRKAGLSTKEAEQAEARRWKEYEVCTPPPFGGIFPSEVGSRLVYVGLFQGRASGYRGGNITECLFRGPDGRWLGVAAAKVKFALNCIRSAYGVRIKLTDISWRRCPEASQKRGVSMYLEDYVEKDMNLEGVAVAIGRWEKTQAGSGRKVDTQILEDEVYEEILVRQKGLCGIMMPLQAPLDLHVPDDACGLWTEEDYLEEKNDSTVVPDGVVATQEAKEGEKDNVEVVQMGMF
jgi:hypothetical protein